ncbi:MAG: Holliday junction ATP-dependent helicase RuvA [Pseudomonadota bacterium]|jgi:Holliday junction DNA helicase RuvA
MIEHLSGNILQKETSKVVIGVNGVGYGVEMPLSSICTLGRVGEPVSAWIETHVREDAIKLFGFVTQEEKDLFNIVCSVSGVGPRIGLAILGSMQPAQIVAAVVDGRKEMLESVPGVGKRLAERLAVELKPKLERYLKNRPAALTGLRSGALAGAPVSAQVDLFGSSPAKAGATSLLADAQSALENLGFKDKDVMQALGKVMKRDGGLEATQGTGDNETLTHLIKEALVELRGW